MARTALLMAGMTVVAHLAFSQHPRPDFERTLWQSLNGTWEFQFDPQNVGVQQNWQNLPKPYERTIRVPFAWESKLSGIGDTNYKGVAWYRREFSLPEKWRGKRIWLCFGAVDHHATVWLNGERVGEHEGGYSEFRFDITPYVRFDRPNVVVVRVEDHTDRSTPLGKQTPEWYTSVSGIWQSVWLEATGAAAIQHFRIIPLANEAGVPTGVMEFTVEIDRAAVREPLQLELRSRNRLFPTLRFGILEGETTKTFRLVLENPRLWTPQSPHLYPFELRLLSEDGKRLQDAVRGYFGVRTVRWGTYKGSEFSYVLLNGEPVYLRGVLDQSYNPDGLYTAPDDAFLKREIELAKQAGFNMLRIHIKADEPRKLYWADKLGILVQADIPCFFVPSERARTLFEKTLRDQIRRDFNHPSIIAWTIFNEEWGIGRLNPENRAHRVEWVLQMVRLARALDPTRLIHDNSGWAHLETDLNSFHWYGRNIDLFRHQYQIVNRQEVGVGKTWNYIDEQRSRGEPFINNEFGYVAASDGDGDWSWGGLMLVNTLRGLNRLVGYTYTELTDVEWEHNGVYNYDRSPKEYGFDFWAAGMSLRDLFAEDFLVLDVPAIKRAARGEVVQVPILFSHYSGRFAEKPFTLFYRLDYIDALGNRHRGRIRRQVFSRTPTYQLVPLTIAVVRLPNEPCLATLVVWTEDWERRRVHINYTQWLVDIESLPKVEIKRGRVILRFAPTEYAASEFNLQSKPDRPLQGKHWARGHGYVEYALTIPEGVSIGDIRRIRLRVEVGARAGREKVDWAQRIHPEDYPQTDGKKYPSRVLVEIAGERVATWELPDDPADARGVLSHWAGIERGSYGYLREAVLEMTPVVRARIQQERKLTIRFIVPPDLPGGIALYGATMGCYPLEPTVMLEY
ncbi:MAG: glycoside hydrolase family 2 TIM barrel-domain containing protein [Armatimonadota bacterium]|nr:glycoside hydrolase family 2 TIM barrel-domain containing protein [Armatimonadota bacterium]